MRQNRIAFLLLWLVFLFSCSKRQNLHSVLEVVPDNASLLIYHSDASELFNIIQSDSIISQFVESENQTLQSGQFGELISYIQQSNSTLKLLKNSPVLFFYRNLDKSYETAFCLELKNPVSSKDFKKNLYEIAIYFEYSVKDTLEQKMFVLNKSDNPNIYVLPDMNLVCISTTYSVCEEIRKNIVSRHKSCWSKMNLPEQKKHELIVLQSKNFIQDFLSKAFSDSLIFRNEFIPAASAFITGISNDIYLADITENQKDEGEYSQIVQNIPEEIALYRKENISAQNISKDISNLVDSVCETVFLNIEQGIQVKEIIQCFRITDKLKFRNSMKTILDFRSVQPEFQSGFDGFQSGIIRNDKFKWQFSTEEQGRQVFCKYNDSLFLVSDRMQTLERFVQILKRTAQNSSKDEHINSFMNLALLYPYLLENSVYEKELLKLYPFLSSFKIKGIKSINNKNIDLKLVYDPENWHRSLLQIAEREFADKSEIVVDSVFANIPKKKVPDGMYKQYYPDSTVHVKGNIAKGRAAGSWRFYNTDASIMMILDMEQGVPDGKCLFYYTFPKDKLRVSCGFKSGKLHGQFVEYSLQGKPSYICEYKDGEIFGNQKLFYQSGSLKAELITNSGEILLYSPIGDILTSDIKNTPGGVLQSAVIRIIQ